MANRKNYINYSDEELKELHRKTLNTQRDVELLLHLIKQERIYREHHAIDSCKKTKN